MEEIQPIIKNQLATLTPNLRAFVTGNQWPADLRLITDQLHLTQEQADDLSLETMFVLTNMESIEDYITNISQEVGLPLDTSGQIAKMVDDKIFSQLYKIIDWDKSETKPQPQSNQPTPRGIKTFTLPTDPVGERLEKTVSLPPSNLPTNENNGSKPPLVSTPNYSDGDPYREPIE